MIGVDTENREAKFNSGIAKLIRIGKLREACHDARTAKNFILWFSCLQGIRSEINAKLTKNVNDKKKSEVDSAEEYENAAKLWLDKEYEETVEVNNQKGKVKNIDIYKLLYEYELWLGEIEEKYKLGMPDEDNIWLEGENI